MAIHPIVAGRKLEALRHALGPTVLAALEDPAVVEILANPDGRLILDRSGEGRRDTGEVLSPEARERVIKLIADYVGESVTRDDPRLSGVLPGSGERFQGLLAPIVTAPTFSIRKRPAVIWSLSDYVRDGVMTSAQAEALGAAALERRNILISGGTGSGKTTLANAVLAEPAFAQDRVFLIEDTPELQCSAWDVVSVLTRRAPVAIGVVDLVREASGHAARNDQGATGRSPESGVAGSLTNVSCCWSDAGDLGDRTQAPAQVPLGRSDRFRLLALPSAAPGPSTRRRISRAGITQGA